jgi:hypothetical protein
MPVTIHWFDDTKEVLVISFEGDWTWEEYNLARRELHAVQDKVDHPVDHVYDLSTSGRLPYNILAEFTTAAQTAHPNTSGLIVFVTNNRLLIHLGSVFNVINPVSHIDVTFIDSMDAVAEHITERRPFHRAGIRS